MTEEMTEEQMLQIRDETRRRLGVSDKPTPRQEEPKPVASQPSNRIPPPEEQKRYTVEDAFGPEWVTEQKRKVCRRMMGETSRFAGLLLKDPTGLETKMTTKMLCELTRPRQFYLLIGGTGCGKTHAAVGFVAEQRGASKQFITAYEIGIALQQRDHKRLAQIEEAEYLIIDDLGAEGDGYKGADVVAHIDHLINSRYEHGRMTVITTNLLVENTFDSAGNVQKIGIKQRYGDRFVSRFSSNGKVIISDDPDFRIHGTIAHKAMQENER